MNLSRLKKLRKGFTLIELLVVIAIVGILAIGLIALINPAAKLANARNATRRSAMKQMNAAIERYQITYGTYPNTNSAWCAPQAIPGWVNCGADWIPGLIASGELKVLPLEPTIGQSNHACSPATYGYLSNGTDYKLYDYCGPEGTLSQTDPMADPPRWSHTWSFYSPGAVDW